MYIRERWLIYITTSIQKWGNSQGVRIPKVLLDTVKWAENEQITIIADNGKLIIEKAKLSIVCPITNRTNHFPLHIPLDERTKTTGVILCERLKSVDLNSRAFQVIEELPEDILKKSYRYCLFRNRLEGVI